MASDLTQDWNPWTHFSADLHKDNDEVLGSTVEKEMTTSSQIELHSEIPSCSQYNCLDCENPRLLQRIPTTIIWITEVENVEDPRSDIPQAMRP